MSKAPDEVIGRGGAVAYREQEALGGKHRKRLPEHLRRHAPQRALCVGSVAGTVVVARRQLADAGYMSGRNPQPEDVGARAQAQCHLNGARGRIRLYHHADITCHPHGEWLWAHGYRERQPSAHGAAILEQTPYQQGPVRCHGGVCAPQGLTGTAKAAA